jgi:dolichol-phosphate mannosyltransferase
MAFAPVARPTACCAGRPVSDPRPATPSLAVVVPCHRVAKHVLGVLREIGPEVDRIYVVDDACPEGSGRLVASSCHDPRVRVLSHEAQRGVGGAVLTGYRAALADRADILVKLDGDGQMDPALIGRLVRPILQGEADYAKGNRFYRLDGLRAMPRARLVGNVLLSFLTKFSTGYWDLFDPTNGFTALHARVAAELPLDKLSEDWFFESDLLFRLSTIRAVVTEIPMEARYADEVSNLRIAQVVAPFLWRHLRNFGKRLFYGYYLRGFSLASVELALGLLLLLVGTTLGAYHWVDAVRDQRLATSGTVMLAALPVIVGVQLLLAFVSHDLQHQPREPLHPRL